MPLPHSTPKDTSLNQPADDNGTTVLKPSLPRESPQFVSLRVKLLVGFSLIFSIVFAGAFYWFYTFTTDKTISRLRADLRSTLEGAVDGVDVDELMSLYEDGVPNSEGFSDDPRYKNQLAWFETVKSIEPRAWLYSFVIAPKDSQQMEPSGVPNSQLETIYLVDLWVNHDTSKAVGFLESDEASSRPRIAMDTGQLIEEPNIYPDDWGTWMSAFAPLKNDDGQIVAILGLDIEADYVFQLQDQIRNRVLMSFVVTYGILFVLIYVLSGVLTRHITELTQSAEQIAVGDYTEALSLSRQHRSSRNSTPRQLPAQKMASFRNGLRDEISVLAQAFEVMIESIQQREQMIRQGKKVEDEMRLALKAERELNELKSRFVSMVSHEFRTPLTVMRTSTELLEHYGHLASAEKKQAYFQRIRAAIANMTRLLEDVLVAGKAEAGKLAFNPKVADFERFCRDLISEMQHSVGLKHSITLSTTGDISSIAFDSDLLRPVLSNLLSNAIKYSDAGSTIRVSVSRSDTTVVLDVADEGIGIPKEDQSKLFQLFHRAGNVDTIRGTGLGLAIVQQCITQHKGHVSFVSEETVGTTFYVRFPIANDANPSGMKPSLEAPTVPSAALDTMNPAHASQVNTSPTINQAATGRGNRI